MTLTKHGQEPRQGNVVTCSLCAGEGATYAVWGQLDTYEKCPRCDGRGATRIKPDAEYGESSRG